MNKFVEFVEFVPPLMVFQKVCILTNPAAVGVPKSLHSYKLKLRKLYMQTFWSPTA